jgi:hypothetical protein
MSSLPLILIPDKDAARHQEMRYVPSGKMFFLIGKYERMVLNLR